MDLCLSKRIFGKIRDFGNSQEFWCFQRLRRNRTTVARMLSKATDGSGMGVVVKRPCRVARPWHPSCTGIGGTI
jgi:hypothetical protein